MNTGLQKLPIGIQSFEDLRSKGYAYVDKTDLIYRMVTTGKPYFLSRPAVRKEFADIDTGSLFPGEKRVV